MAELDAGRYVLKSGIPGSGRQKVSTTDGYGPALNVVDVFDESDFGTDVAGRWKLHDRTAFKIKAPITLTKGWTAADIGPNEISSENFFYNSITANIGATSLFKTNGDSGFYLHDLVVAGDNTAGGSIFDLTSTRSANATSYFASTGICVFFNFKAIGTIAGYNLVEIVNMSIDQFETGITFDGNRLTMLKSLLLEKGGSTTTTDITLDGVTTNVLISQGSFSKTANSTALHIVNTSTISDGKVSNNVFEAGSNSVFSDPAGLDKSDPNWLFFANDEADDSEYIGSMGFNDNTTDTVISVQGIDGTITSIADAGGGDIRVSSAAHGRIATDEVVLVGGTGYDKTYTITNVNDVNTFDVTATFAATGTGVWEYGWTDLLGTAVAGDEIERYTVSTSPNELTSGIKNTHKGVGHFNVTAEKSGGANDFQFRLFKNEIVVSLGKTSREITTVSGSLSGAPATSSNTADVFKVMTRNMAGTSDILIVDYTLTIK